MSRGKIWISLFRLLVKTLIISWRWRHGDVTVMTSRAHGHGDDVETCSVRFFSWLSNIIIFYKVCSNAKVETYTEKVFTNYTRRNNFDLNFLTIRSIRIAFRKARQLKKKTWVDFKIFLKSYLEVWLLQRFFWLCRWKIVLCDFPRSSCGQHSPFQWLVRVVRLLQGCSRQENIRRRF